MKIIKVLNYLQEILFLWNEWHFLTVTTQQHLKYHISFSVLTIGNSYFVSNAFAYLLSTMWHKKINCSTVTFWLFTETLKRYNTNNASFQIWTELNNDPVLYFFLSYLFAFSTLPEEYTQDITILTVNQFFRLMVFMSFC